MQRACQHSICASAPASVCSLSLGCLLCFFARRPFYLHLLLKRFCPIDVHPEAFCFSSHHLTSTCKTWLVCVTVIFSSPLTVSPGPLSLWQLPPLCTRVDFLLPATSPVCPQGPSSLSYFAPHASLITSTHFSPSSRQISQPMPASACFTGSQHISRRVYNIHELKSTCSVPCRKMELAHSQVWESFCLCFQFFPKDKCVCCV